MKFLLTLSLCLALSCNSTAQSFEEQINTQVWKPFIKAFNEHDTQGFMEVHSRDVIRSPRDAKAVWNYDEYFQQQQRGDKSDRASDTSRHLELRFTERIYGKDAAIEVGIYKTTYTQSDGVTRSFYGRFHVVHRRENGVWKILLDTDSSEKGTVSEREFLEALPME
jgi:ketosteroid isomerase-like protein